MNETANMDMTIAIGFGSASVYMDDELIWDETRDAREFDSWDDFPCLSDFERYARENPDREWTVVIDGPLYGATYRREGMDRWMLVRWNRGFA